MAAAGEVQEDGSSLRQPLLQEAGSSGDIKLSRSGEERAVPVTYREMETAADVRCGVRASPSRSSPLHAACAAACMFCCCMRVN